MSQIPESNPLRRLKNLERAHARVVVQLANPNLSANHRPDVIRRLDSISEEIAQLQMMAK